MGGEGVWRGGSVSAAEYRAVPGSENPARAACGWVEGITVEPARKKGVNFEGGDGAQFSFLKKHDVRADR